MGRRHKWEPGERVLAVCTGTWHYGVGVIRSGPDKNNRYVVEFDRDGLCSGCRVIGRPQENERMRSAMRGLPVSRLRQ